MPSGYSPRPLVQKLGIKPGHRIALIGAPAGYDATLGALPPGVVTVRSLRAPLDVVQLFAARRRDLEARAPAAKAALVLDGALWVSWPKKAAKVGTDLDEGVVREYGLALGLVDVKVCAVDEVWSGLKFVYRLRDR